VLSIHRQLKTWQTKVDVYVALSEFGRKKFIAGGSPPERIIVKPNFVYPDPGSGRGDEVYALFAGRLSEDKGLRILHAAYSRLDSVHLKKL